MSTKVTRKEVTEVLERQGLKDTPENRAEIRQRLEARAEREAAPAVAQPAAAAAPTGYTYDPTQQAVVPVEQARVATNVTPTPQEAEPVRSVTPAPTPTGYTYDPTQQAVVPVEQARTATNVAPAPEEAEPVRSVTPVSGATGGATGGVTGGATGGLTAETEIERIARLEREQQQRQFEESQRFQEEQFRQQRQSAEELAGRQRESAFARLTSYLSEYGLTDLEGMLNDLLAKGIEEESAVLFELRNTPSFKKRFAANEARKAAGLPALTPRSYVDMENTYREILRRGGMLEYFNRQDVFESLIGGDVSPSELYDRMTNAYQVVRDADLQTKMEMRRLYQVEDKDLAAYFLDPKTSVSTLKRRAEAARIAAAGTGRAGMQLEAQTAEDIAARGYSAEQAGEAFSKISELSGLYQPLTGEETVSESEKIGAAFGYDPAAQEKLRRRVSVRRAEFAGGGQYASARGVSPGTIETGLGGPQ